MKNFKDLKEKQKKKVQSMETMANAIIKILEIYDDDLGPISCASVLGILIARCMLGAKQPSEAYLSANMAMIESYTASLREAGMDDGLVKVEK